MQYTGVQKKTKYSFSTKTFNDNVFQLIDSNYYCINTFWIDAIPQALYISGKGV